MEGLELPPNAKVTKGSKKPDNTLIPPKSLSKFMPQIISPELDSF